MTTSLGAQSSPLIDRALELLASGPADSQTLVSHVCSLPGAPPNIAEHMATAIFAGHGRFARGKDGRWFIREAPLASAAANELNQLSYIVVDVETTGGAPYSGDRVIEIGAVRVDA